MQIDVTLPFDKTGQAAEFGTMAAVQDIGTALERAGFTTGRVTDHPAPTGRWLDTGGHHAQSPFVMLALLAAHTTTLRLGTGILVLPYRNPLIVARDVTTLDAFSGGRVTLSVGAGYLKGEYFALGVDFEKRNDLMDEYIQALRLAVAGEEFSFEGTGYSARGIRIEPGSPQKPLPILVGGNAKRAIRRAVDSGDGWNPFLTPGTSTDTARTAAITGVEDLAASITYMRDYAGQQGKPMPQVALSGIMAAGSASSQALVDELSAFDSIGVSSVALSLRGKSRSEWCDDAERIGAEVITKLS